MNKRVLFEVLMVMAYFAGCLVLLADRSSNRVVCLGLMFIGMIGVVFLVRDSLQKSR